MPLITPGMRCLVLALAVVPALCAQDPGLAERLFRSGERAYAAHSYNEAIETWNQLIRQAPGSPFAAHALMDLARHQADVEKRPDAALPLLEKIKADHLGTPWAAEAMLLRGQHPGGPRPDPGRSGRGPGRFRPGGGPVPRPPRGPGGSVRAGAVLPPPGPVGAGPAELHRGGEAGPRFRGRPEIPAAGGRDARSHGRHHRLPAHAAVPAQPPPRHGRKPGKPSGGSRCWSRSASRNPPCAPRAPGPKGGRSGSRRRPFWPPAPRASSTSTRTTWTRPPS